MTIFVPVAELNAAQMTLPEMCLVFLPDGSPGKYVGIVRRGETGYYATTYNCQTPDQAKQLVAHVNGQLGVTKLQATCLYNGSLFGWHTPGSDPEKFGKLMAERAYKADACIPA